MNAIPNDRPTQTTGKQQKRHSFIPTTLKTPANTNTTTTKSKQQVILHNGAA